MKRKEQDKKVREQKKKAGKIQLVCKIVSAAALIVIGISACYAAWYLTAPKKAEDSPLWETLSLLAEGVEQTEYHKNDYPSDGKEYPGSTGETDSLDGRKDMDLPQEENMTAQSGAGNAPDPPETGNLPDPPEEEIVPGLPEEENVPGSPETENVPDLSDLPEEENAPDPPETDNTQEQQTLQAEREAQVREMVNALSLNPQSPENQALEELLKQLMPQIVGDCEDTYEQVKACYDYLIENCSFSTTVKYDYAYDAYLLLTEFHGSCTYYVAALHYMLLYIGVDNSIVSGYRYPDAENHDRSSFHRWIEIELEGTPYVLDPQWEDTLILKDEILYERFFYTHEELSQYYAF